MSFKSCVLSRIRVLVILIVWTKFLSRSSRTDLQSPLTSSQNLILYENCPTKSPIFLPTTRWNSGPVVWLRRNTWPAFDYKKKNHDDLTYKQHSLWQLQFVKLKNHENARKQTERTPSIRTLGPCGTAIAKKKKNLLRPSFLLRRSPSNVRSVMPLHQASHCLYDYQACSVGLKMDVYMHRRQESRSESTVNRSTEFEVTTFLRRISACTSVIVGYGMKMKRRLCVFFLRSWQRRRRSEIGCYVYSARRGAAFHRVAWEMFEHWRKNNWWVCVWEVFVMKWLGLISPQKISTKGH